MAPPGNTISLTFTQMAIEQGDTCTKQYGNGGAFAGSGEIAGGMNACDVVEVCVGLGRIVALYCRSSTAHHIR